MRGGEVAVEQRLAGHGELVAGVLEVALGGQGAQADPGRDGQQEHEEEREREEPATDGGARHASRLGTDGVQRG